MTILAFITSGLTDITAFVSAIMPFVTAVGLPFLYPLLRNLYLWLQQTLALNKHALLKDCAKIAVHAVEQAMTAPDPMSKKRAAVNCVEDLLKEFNLTVSPQVVDAMIESLVYELKVLEKTAEEQKVNPLP